MVYHGYLPHIDRRLIHLAIQTNIKILKLLSHFSHLLQPLDLGVFKSMKLKWDFLIVK